MILIATETGKSERQKQTFDVPTKKQDDVQREAAKLFERCTANDGENVPAHFK